MPEPEAARDIRIALDEFAEPAPCLGVGRGRRVIRRGRRDHRRRRTTIPSTDAQRRRARSPGASRSMRVATSASTVSGSSSGRRPPPRGRRELPQEKGVASAALDDRGELLLARAPVARGSVEPASSRPPPEAARAGASAPATAASPRPRAKPSSPGRRVVQVSHGRVGSWVPEVTEQLCRGVVHPVDVLDESSVGESSRCPSSVPITPWSRARRNEGSRSSTSGVDATSASSGAASSGAHGTSSSSICSQPLAEGGAVVLAAAVDVHVEQRAQEGRRNG